MAKEGSFSRWLKAVIARTKELGSRLFIRRRKSGKKLSIPRFKEPELEDIEEGIDTVSVQKNPTSIFSLSPGDIVAFYYTLEGSGWRVVLVVSNKRGPSGWFRSSGTKNLLNSCYRIDTVTPETLEVILKVIYKARNRSDYYKLLPFFRNVFGEKWGKYRTYRMDRIESMYEIYYKL